VGIDLESLRKLLKNENDISLLIARIDKLAPAGDASCLRVLCSIVPDEIEIVARMSWQAVGPEAGFFQLFH